MTNAEELLNSLNEEDIINTPTVEEHIIVGPDRFITVPEPLQRIAVQYDHNVETVTFDCPRYWDEHDLSTLDIYVNYNREDGIKSRSNVKNIVVDENDENIIHFDWTITEEITSVPGKLFFLVCAVRLNEEGEEELHWNSELNNQMYVSTGLEGLESVYERYPDIITDLLTRMDYVLVGDGTVLDKSMTLENFAAEAKAVGDRFVKNENEIGEINNEINTMNTNITKNTNGIIDINTEINTMNTNITKNTNDITDINTEINTMNTKIENNTNNISNNIIDINNLKNTFEYGEFTPVITDGTVIVDSGYTLQKGTYYRIGKLVSFNINIKYRGFYYNNKTVNDLIDIKAIVQIGGLPFTSSEGETWSCICDYVGGVLLDSDHEYYEAKMVGGDNHHIQFRTLKFLDLNDTESSTLEIHVSGFYYAN